MSIFAGPRTVPASGGGVSAIERVKAYFFSDSGRAIQTVLGLIWLLDGALQFQAFMYGKGFIQFLTNLTAGQPRWVSSSVTWGATTLRSHQSVFNTASALVQIAIGVGLLYRPTASRRSPRRSDGFWSCGGSARRSG